MNMKNRKLNLNDLKVCSFVTNFDPSKEETVKGGSHITGCGLCDTDDFFCQTTPQQCIVTIKKLECFSNYRSCGIWCPIPDEPAVS